MLFIFLYHSCSDSDVCTDTDLISRVNAGFYVRDSIEERDTVLSNVTLYSLLRPDSLIYDAALSLGRLEFPLPHTTEENTSFVLQVDSLSDTIDIWHTPNSQLFSYACGFYTTHNIFWYSFDTTFIDTIFLPDPNINLNDAENLKIFIKPPAPIADTIQ